MTVHVSKNAALATGDASSAANTGIDIIPASPLGSAENNSQACFRLDVNTPTSTPPNSCKGDSPIVSNNTPGNYSDDCWHCYTLRKIGGSATNGLLYDCLRSSAQFCNPGTGDILVGAARSFTATYTTNTNAANLQNYVDITITSLSNNSILASDPITNPTYTLTTRVNPIGQSQTYTP